MSSAQSCNESLLSVFEVHLRTEGYSQNNSRVYIAQARRSEEHSLNSSHITRSRMPSSA